MSADIIGIGINFLPPLTPRAIAINSYGSSKQKKACQKMSLWFFGLRLKVNNLVNKLDSKGEIMKKLLFLFMLSVVTLGFVWAQGYENFTNLPTTTPGSYLARTWTGTDGVAWTAEGARTDQSLEGKAICFGNTSHGNRWVTSPPYSGGMGTLSFKYVRGFTGTNARSLQVWVNGNQIGSDITVSPSSNDVITYSEVINIAGDITLQIRSTGAAQVIVDEIIWTAFSSGAPVPPSITNISTIPATDITPSTDVYVSATITDADGDVDSAELSWGLSSGNLPNNIDMVKGANDVWTTETPIPAQPDGTTVYYTIYALDDDANDTTSAEQSYISLTPQPQLNLSIATLSGFSYIVGNGPSAAKYFKVSGSNLTEDVLLTAPDHYEISLTEDADYDDALLLDVVGDELAETTLYVRLIAGLEVGDYNGEEVEIESSGETKILTLNGMVKPVPPAGYYVDFEDASKAAWALANIELNGIEWSLEQALIGSDDNDMKEDNKAVRIRQNSGVYGQMTMLQPKTGGIGTISFYYARANFSNDRTGNSPVFVVEYSVDGEHWRQAGDEVDLAGVNELTLFSHELNLVCDLMVRIRQTAGDSGKRWNLDNFLMTDYEGPCELAADILEFNLTELAPDLKIIIDGGDAQILNTPIPDFQNSSFVPDHSFVLRLLGAGPWSISWVTDAQYGAYYQGSEWHVVPNTGSSRIYFINILASKDLDLPVLFGDQDPTLPVELSSFLVSMNAVNQAVLTWISQSETALAGYYILRNNTEDLGTAVQISNLIPATNSSTPYSYSYVDSELNEHGSYYYWLQVNDLDGSIGYHGPINLVYGATEDPELPPMVPQTELKRIYPNPFNPSTNVAFYLAKAANVNLKIYNHRGQLVRSLHEGYKEAGDYRLNWDGKDEKGAALSTGVYFFRLEAGKKVFTQKAVLMK